jgi:predicted metal-dependent phosphotriesterase family hydrolase
MQAVPAKKLGPVRTTAARQSRERTTPFHISAGTFALEVQRVFAETTVALSSLPCVRGG